MNNLMRCVHSLMIMALLALAGCQTAFDPNEAASSRVDRPVAQSKVQIALMDAQQVSAQNPDTVIVTPPSAATVRPILPKSRPAPSLASALNSNAPSAPAAKAAAPNSVLFAALRYGDPFVSETNAAQPNGRVGVPTSGDGARSGRTTLLGPVRKSVTQVATLRRKPNFFERAAMRKKKYAPLIAKHARAHGVPVHLAIAVVEIESSFRVKARGGVGEVGLMQIRPRTARGMGYRGTNGDLYNPETNVHYGMKYLAEAHRRGGGTTCGTILKYNAGHYAKRMNPISAKYCRRVKKLMKKNRKARVI